MRIAALSAAAALAACGAPPRARVTPPPTATTYRFRTPHASFELVLDGARATLVQRDEPRASSTTYTGTRTDAGHGELDLALATPGQQPLALHCMPTRVAAAAAGAELACGDRVTWTPAGTTAVAALVCAPPGETGSDAAPPDPDDEDQLVFAAPPGLERTSLPEGCAGLRMAR